MSGIKKLLSIAIGIALGFIAFRFAYGLIGDIVYDRGRNGIIATLAAAIAGTIAFAYVLFAGLYKNKPFEKGVGLFLGSATSYVLPDGWSWWLPRGLGGVIPVNTQALTLDRTKGCKPLEKVLSKDNIEMAISFLAQLRVVDILKNAGTQSPFKAAETAIEQAFREFAALHDSLDLPKKKAEFATHVMNDRALREKLRELGYIILSISVNDIDPPQEIVQANIKKKTEKAESEAEDTETENVIKLMKKYEAAGLVGKDALNAVQAERGKIRRIVIDGNASGGDFTRGAAINTP